MEVSQSRPRSSNIGLWTLFLLVQMGLVTPIERRLGHVRTRGRPGARIADRQRDLARRVAHRIQHWHVVRAGLQRPEDGSVGVDGGIAPIGGNLVVEVRLRIGPIPRRDDDVALYAFGPGRLRRHLARRDAVGPVREHLQHCLPAHTVEAGAHPRPGLARLDPPVPSVHGGLEVAQFRRDLPDAEAAELMAGRAIARLHEPEELSLVLDVRRDPVSLITGPRKLVPFRHVEQRRPVTRRVILRRCPGVGRRHRGQVQSRARRGAKLVRIDQAVASHPHVVARLGQVGDQIPALIVGHDDPGEARRKVGRLRDHPDAGLRSARSGHDTPDVVGVERGPLGSGFTRRECGGRDRTQPQVAGGAEDLR